MITFSELGQFGRLGNQLFQIAATISLAIDHNQPFVFPEWKYAKCFKKQIPQSKSILQEVKRGNWQKVPESKFFYSKSTLDIGFNNDIEGYYQSEKNFRHNWDKIKEYFEWDEGFYHHCLVKAIPLTQNVTCAMHIRRGDYIGNENYVDIQLDYYYRAMAQFTNDIQFLVFSDDIEWCKQNIKTDRTILFAEGNSDIEDLCIMSMCDEFIIPNSSFGWWGACLGEKDYSHVYAPDAWFGGLFKYKNDSKDIIPDRWFKFPVVLKPEIKHEPADLTDVTFTIPIKWDHPDREENLLLIIAFLKHYFKTNIVVCEYDKEQHLSHVSSECEYLFVKATDNEFPRTRLLNMMAKMATTPIIANYDCDVVFNPVQILQAVEKIRKRQCSGCSPYDGMFLRAMRELDKFKQTFTIDDLNLSASEPAHFKQYAVGGAIFWNKADFIAGGMENEKMISYGPEDFERFHRFPALGYKVDRVDGPLIHINHWVGKDSSPDNPHFQNNWNEYEKIKLMMPHDLRKYVASWPWTKTKELPYQVSKDLQLLKPSGSCPLVALEFDRIYCLNLPRRSDRRQYAEKKFKEIDLQNVHFFDAVDGAVIGLKHTDLRITAGMLGCYQSHLNILKEAIEKNFKRILIFEDDFKPVDGFNIFLNLSLPVLPDDWQFAYLGCNEYGGFASHKKELNDYWVVPECAWGTQAFMINGYDSIKTIYKLLKERQSAPYQIDETLSNNVLPNSGLNYYSIFPSIVSQQFELLGTDVQGHKTK